MYVSIVGINIFLTDTVSFFVITKFGMIVKQITNLNLIQLTAGDFLLRECSFLHELFFSNKFKNRCSTGALNQRPRFACSIINIKHLLLLF